MCISAATYVQNRMSTKALGGRTPYEIVYRDTLDISHSGRGRIRCALCCRRAEGDVEETL